MAAMRNDPYPDFHQATPHRQLLTVSELEQLFGPDATVELRSTRPEHVEADLEVIPPPPRRTSRWMAPVLLVVFAAASFMGYALLRNTAAVETATNVASWLGKSTLGPTEETLVERDYRLPPLVARISGPVAPDKSAAPAPAEPAADDSLPVVLPSLEPASPVETAPAAPAKAQPKLASSPKPMAPRAARVTRAQRAPAAGAAAARQQAEDRATQQLIEREVERLESAAAPAGDRTETETGTTYPPGYIEAEID